MKHVNYPFYDFCAIRAAYIHLSDLCNFRCKTCRLPEARGKLFIPLQLLKSKIKKAVGLKLNNLIFTGQETLLHPHIDEIIRFSFQDCKANYITFNTNGMAFSNKKIQKKLSLIKRYRDKIYIALSVNFFDAATFHDWSGCSKNLFQRWCAGVQETLETYPGISFDIILKKDIDVIKVLNSLSRISDGKSHGMNLRILDLMPFGPTVEKLYKELKPQLSAITELIPKIFSIHKGKLWLESFPVCAHNQKYLKEEKYYLYNFHIAYQDTLLGQYDPAIYETYFDGPTENWLINVNKLCKAYEKMFIYLDECNGCYYKNRCYGIQREYVRLYGESQTNKEISLLKQINWQ